MNCCSNDEMAGETLTSMFGAGFNLLHSAIIWLVTFGQVSSSVNTQDTSVWKTFGFLSSDTIVSLLFIVHVVVVVAFIISHCTVKKKKSQ